MLPLTDLNHKTMREAWSWCQLNVCSRRFIAFIAFIAFKDIEVSTTNGHGSLPVEFALQIKPL
ncbi:hypothetical protein QUF58_14790 [Anaerolineales bacterium HSG24]|nr:hypothetical protein [Anaerolineales bacterium HSG24]